MPRLLAVLVGCWLALLVPLPLVAARPARGVEVIIKLFADSPLPARLLAKLGAHSSQRLAGHTYLVSFSADRSGEQLAQQLAALPGVIYAEPNYARSLLAATNDPLLGQQWHLASIQAEAAWARSTGGAIVIAVLDTGVAAGHPDLQGRIGAGADLFNGDEDPADDEGHGTHVAGLIAANGNNGEGGAGLCWGCVVLPIKVLGQRGRGTDATIAAGIRLAVDRGARIITMSLGGPDDSRTLREAVAYAVERNVLLVAAAGNDGARGTQPNYPAAYPGVLAVGATDERDRLTDFSTSGDFVGIAAPGANILSSYWSVRSGNTYAVASGTSEAAPQVAGVAGLLLSIRPELNATQVAELIQASADDIDAPGRDPSTGFGRLNAARAAELAATPDALARSRIQGQVAGAAPDQITLRLSSGQQIQPDASGFFSFDGLAAGSYSVVASLPDGQQRTQQARVSGTQLGVATLEFSFAPGSDAFAPVAAPPLDQADFFVETGHTLRGAFRDYWRANGGLPVFGFPISEELTELDEGGQPRSVQYFERNRFELHPENAPPYHVQLGRLGDTVLRQQNRDWFGFAVGAPVGGCLFFAETQHTLCEPFLGRWRSNGLELDGRRGKSAAESLALFGLPLSEPQVEQLPDGGTRMVQWFERARFEDHGSSGVLLGLLGRESVGR